MRAGRNFLSALLKYAVIALLVLITAIQNGVCQGPGSSAAILNFAVVKDSSGMTPLCGLQTESVGQFVARSRLDCAQQCRAGSAVQWNEWECVGFNFLPDNKTCQLFNAQPTWFSAQDGCVYYGRTCTWEPQCSFPFTYNGQLYYTCVLDVTNVATTQHPYACLTANRTWTLCSSNTSCTVQNITENITIPTLPGSTAVMSVNDWIIFQQRLHADFSFHYLWIDYQNGFGSLGSDYWMGNEKVHLLTSSGSYRLRFEMLSIGSGWVSAEYDSFLIDDEAHFYKIHVAGFNGDAGDSMIGADQYFGNGMNFSTTDNLNDQAFEYLGYISCPAKNGGGWWYNNCFMGCMNGDISYSFSWWTLPNGSQYMNASRMMLRKN